MDLIYDYGTVAGGLVYSAGGAAGGGGAPPDDVSTPGSLIAMSIAMLGGGAAVDAVTPGSVIVLMERLVSSYATSAPAAPPLLVSPGRMMCR